MGSKLFVVGLLALVLLVPLTVGAGSAEMSRSAYWTNLVHQENSVVASLLYLPYMFLSGPIRLLDGLVYPKPTSQSTTPPPAHRVGP